MTLPHPSDPRLASAEQALAVGQPAVAEEQLRTLLRTAPALAPAWALLARIAEENGRRADCLQIWQAGLGHCPTDAPLAEMACRAAIRLGQPDMALQAANALTSRAPQSPTGWQLMGAVLGHLGRRPEAAESYRRAAALAPDDVESHLGLGEVLAQIPDFPGALAAFQAAEQLDPDHPGLAFQLTKLLDRGVPQWHWPMMNDGPRNQAYEAAITRHAPGRIVLEIGTGSGLLAMMAARAGATHVYSCEAQPVIAAAARDIVAANGFADRITIIDRPSTALDLSDLGGRKADMLMSEILSNDLLSEYVLSAVWDARLRLVAADAPIVPRRAAFRVQPVAGNTVSGHVRSGMVSGFDLSAINRLGPRLRQIEVRGMDWQPLGPPVDLFSFDFSLRPPGPERREIILPVARAGLLAGLIGWLSVDLTDGVHFENKPLTPGLAAPPSGWQQMLYPAPPGLNLVPGSTLKVMAAHDTMNIHVRVLSASTDQEKAQ